MEDDDSVYITPHPFNKLPSQELSAALVEAGRQAQRDYPKVKQAVTTLLNRFDPLHVLSVIGAYSLFGGLDGRNEVSGPISSLLEQAHIELAQAIALRTEVQEGRDICRPPDFQQIFDSLKELAVLFTNSRLSQIERAKGKQEKAYLQFAERLRTHTQYVRNWGHYADVLQILNGLYAPLDEDIRSVAGLSASQLIECFRYMLEQVETRWNKKFVALKYVFAGNTRREVIERYFERFSDLEDDSDRFFQMAKKNKWSAIQLRVVLMSHAELRYQDAFIFDSDELAAHLKIDCDSVSKALDLLALSFGDLSDFEFDHIFLGNPIWEKPLIRLDEQHFFCLMPQLFFGFSHHIFEALVADDQKKKNRLEKCRANYLESKIRDLFLAAFPTAQVVCGQKWKLDGTEYETDLLVKIDSHLIIIEAKSGTIPWVALRGGIERAKSRIERLIAGPAKQAARLESAFLATSGEQQKFEIELPFEREEVQRTVKLAVTLEDFATIQSNTAELIELGAMPNDVPLAATINIADLKVVLEVLENEAERIHYLDKRNEIQKNVKYVGDEMDLLAFYCRKGLNFGKYANGEAIINLLGMSQPIDDYYQSVFHGGKPIKPRRLMTKWFRDMIIFLSDRKIPRWSEIAIILLDVEIADQRKLEAEVNKVSRVLKKDGTPSDNQINTIIHVPNVAARYGIAVAVFFEDQRPTRHTIIGNAASHVFEQSTVERCLVIARDIEGKDYPYTTAVVTTPESN